MNLSYWEYKSWLSNIDFTVIGSGIVGLNCALQLRTLYPKAKILVLEKGVLPQGASTKNAGFACFGSISEVLSDLKTHTEDEVVKLVQQRRDGMLALRQLLGDKSIDFQVHGGHELFLAEDQELYQNCLENLKTVNTLLHPIFGDGTFEITANHFGFKGIEKNYISHIFEGQLDTGKMMSSLLQLALAASITILNSVTVESYEENAKGVEVKTDKFGFQTNKLLIATNGFSNKFLDEKIKPARAQVLITKPIENLKIKGTFHLQEGYYYFRNIDNRILLGGGRNLDFKTEETTQFGETKLVQQKLHQLLETLILPGTPFEIDYSWSGIMGVGSYKKPIIKQLSNNTACGVRLGGMGVAIGTSVGKQLANIFGKLS